MLEVLLNVLAVIGIIVVGGFVVVFLGNLLLSALDSSSKNNNQNNNVPQQPTYYDQPQQITYQQQPVVMQEPVKQVGYEEVDLKKAQEEEERLNGRSQELDEAYAKLKEEQEALRQEKLKF